MRPAGNSHIIDCAAWRYWRSSRMRGSAFAARRIIDRQNHDRAGMPDDIAAGAHASRLFHFIGGDAEHRPLVTDAGREDASSALISFLPISP
jgi:hypothetical protein